MKKKKLMFVAALLMCFLSALSSWAEDKVYDGCFNRPTYFTDFEQPTKWADAMYVLCKVECTNSGWNIGNYEVAVYDKDGNLRHCSRSLSEGEGLCMLTIPGDKSEEMTLKVLIGDYLTPTVLEVEQKLTFQANAVVGIDTPYVISLGTISIKGDVNNNSVVSISDVCRLVKILRGQASKTKRADVNDDGKYTLADIEALKNLILGK